MSMEIHPPELSFKRPFNHEVCQVLQLHNLNEEAVVFKVKTTAPKHYCVRPNSGRIEPGKSVDVQVLLQAMKEEPALDAKCKDKFLVQSVAVTRDMEFANVTSIFEKTPKSSVVERKIRVNWLASDATEGSGAGETIDDEPPTYTSPCGNFETPAPGLSTKKSTDDTSPLPPPKFSEKPIKSEPSPEPSHENFSSSIASAKSAVASAFPSTSEMQAQLADAREQIQRLKDRLADQGLRQRKTGAEAGGSAPPASMQQQHSQTASGVPLQIVAGLCLLSFLIAYFFF